eukprot:231372-Chlamydomonas_euryale.AAC.3
MERGKRVAADTATRCGYSPTGSGYAMLPRNRLAPPPLPAETKRTSTATWTPLRGSPRRIPTTNQMCTRPPPTAAGRPRSRRLLRRAGRGAAAPEAAVTK